MRPDYISKMSQQPMPSRLNSPSVEGEAEEEAEVTKEEGEVQVTITQVKVTDNITRIKISKVTDNRTRIRTSSLKEAEGEDQMTNQAYNAITVRILGTMNLNDKRSKQINSQAEHMSQIMKEKPQMVCFSHATRLKNNIKIFGCWTVDATIT
jgi:transcriptional regulator of met regulon